MGLIWPKLLVPPAGGNIEFVGGQTASKVGSAGGTSTIALNSGLTGGIASAVSDDDLVIAAFSTGSSADRTLSITTGYTLIASELYQVSTERTFDTNLRVAYKFVSGDTATTFGATGSTADAGAMAVYVFRGVDLTTPLDVAAVTAVGEHTEVSGPLLPNPPSITPVTPGAFIVCIGACGHDDGVDTLSSSDLTGFLSVGSDDSNDTSLGIGHIDNWSSGAFDAAAFTFSGTAGNVDTFCAMSIALRPA